MKLVDEIKASFKSGTNLIKLIYINLGVFLLVQVILAISFLFKLDESAMVFIKYLTLPASGSNLLSRPWSFFSYMFLHENLWHIFINMLALYWFGIIFLKFLNQKKLITVYLLGGLAGGLLYMISYNIFPALIVYKDSARVLGASASVMAIVFATTTIAPNYEILVPFIKGIKIKYFAIAFVVLDVIQMREGNAGGHIAHLGGALLGYYFIISHKKGKDIGAWFDRIMEWFFSLFKASSKSKMKVSHKRPMTDMEYNKNKAEDQKKVDKILDKVAKSGYDSLSKADKDILFNMSKKN